MHIGVLYVRNDFGIYIVDYDDMAAVVVGVLVIAADDNDDYDNDYGYGTFVVGYSNHTPDRQLCHQHQIHCGNGFLNAEFAVVAAAADAVDCDD